MRKEWLSVDYKTITKEAASENMALSSSRHRGLSVRNVTKSYQTSSDGEVPALKSLSIDVADGEFFVLLGPSGCGKTTLLRSIAGFEDITSGQILLNGNRIDTMPPNRRPLNMVFQSYALFPNMNVFRNISFGLEMRGERPNSPSVSEKVHDALSLVGLEGYGGRKIQQLSGGQRQRVALARALIVRPTILLLDEPLAALDFKLRKTMRHELKELQRGLGMSFIFVTHDQVEAMELGDRIAVLEDGALQQAGTPWELYREPANEFVADFIGDINSLTGSLDANNGVKIGSRTIVPKNAIINWEELVRTQEMSGISPVKLLLRPEDIELVSGEGHVRCRVRESVYLGAETMVTVELESVDHGSGEDDSHSTLLMVRSSSEAGRPQYSKRDDVSLRFKEQQCRAVI